MRGFAIFFLTLGRVALADSFFASLCSMTKDGKALFALSLLVS
jgi:hypothetical protein